MTREELIEALSDTRAEYNCFDPMKRKKYHALSEAIEALQEHKTGKWQEVYAETDYKNGWIEFSCENCEYQHGLESGEYGWYYGDDIPWKYCPICGAKMEGEQE